MLIRRRQLRQLIPGTPPPRCLVPPQPQHTHKGIRVSGRAGGCPLTWVLRTDLWRKFVSGEREGNLKQGGKRRGETARSIQEPASRSLVRKPATFLITPRHTVLPPPTQTPLPHSAWKWKPYCFKQKGRMISHISSFVNLKILVNRHHCLNSVNN